METRCGGHKRMYRRKRAMPHRCTHPHKLPEERVRRDSEPFNTKTGRNQNGMEPGPIGALSLGVDFLESITDISIQLVKVTA